MSVSNNNFIDGHAYALTCGLRYRVSYDLGDNYNIKTHFKVEILDIKINNVWKSYNTFINELVTLTGLSFSIIDKQYRELLFKTNGLTFTNIIYKRDNYHADIFNTMFNGVLHSVNSDEYRCAVGYTLDNTLGSFGNSFNKNFENVLITIEPQYIKYAAKVEEFDTPNNIYNTNTHYTGYKKYSNTNIFGFTDLGIATKSEIPFAKNPFMVTYSYKELAAEYDNTIMSNVLGDSGWGYTSESSTVYYKVTVNNHSLYNNKAFILCTGKPDKSGTSSSQGVSYEKYSAALCYKETINKNDSIFNGNSGASAYLTYCTDMYYCADASTIDKTIYNVRLNEHEYYTKLPKLSSNSYTLKVTPDSIETIKKGKYKINLKCEITAPRQDISDLFDIMLNVNGYEFKLPFKSETIYQYIIVETNEDFYTFIANTYLKSKPTKTAHRYASGYTSKKDISINSVLLPKESTSKFGFKINNSTRAITLANINTSVGYSLTTKQLAFHPDYNYPFILKATLDNNSALVYYIVAPNDVNSLTQDSYLHLIIIAKIDSEYGTYGETLQRLIQTNVDDYSITMNNKTYSISIAPHTVTHISGKTTQYSIECQHIFEHDVQLSDIDSFLNNLTIFNNKIATK